ncbi:MAG: asparagine synthetase A [bacterium]|nr:asparagine synthetase A [bacterium]
MLEFEIFEHLKDEKVKIAVRVQSLIIKILRDFLHEKGFFEILPVVISRVTDPLSEVKKSISFEIYGQQYQLTKSMIFHKRMALFNLDRIFTLSPNIRIEEEKKSSTRRHLVEFVQLDVEIKNAKMQEVMNLIEEMLTYLFKRLKDEAKEELAYFGRTLPEISPPFPVYEFEDVYSLYGEDYEKVISENSSVPVWIVHFPEGRREFYYKTIPSTGKMADFDLLYPYGYGEAISGGEREDDRTNVINKLRNKDAEFLKTFYLKLLEEGVPPSAGFGIGIERLTMFVCGLSHIVYTKFFPKLPLKEVQFI